MYETYRKQRFFQGLDGLRAVCALAVVQVHLGFFFRGPLLFRHGDLGVDMFFTISGFLIVTLLLREQDQSGSIHLGEFYRRRALRIFPIYYLYLGGVILLYAAISPWYPNGLRYYHNTFLVVALYLQDFIIVPLGVFFHLWSLAIEEQFYLLWPAVQKYSSLFLRACLLAAVLLISEGSNFGLTSNLVDHLYGSPNAHRLPVFLCTFTPITLGAILAHLLHYRATFERLESVFRLRLLLPVLTLALFLVPELAESNFQGFPKLVMHLLFMLTLATLILRPESLAVRALKVAPLAYIGRISYGVYVFHIPVRQILEFAVERMHLPALPLLLSFFLVSTITVAIAAASYKWFELPLMRLGRSEDSTVRFVLRNS